MQSLATSNGNNCLFHCFTHVLFNLPEGQYNQVKQTQGYNKLLENFKGYYGLATVPTEEEIRELNNTFSDPLEREAVWGPVLRQMLRNEFSDVGITEVSLIADEDFAKLLELFEFNITVEHPYDELAPPIKHEAVETPIFTLEVSHIREGGGHYNFAYPNDDDNTKAGAHNAKVVINHDTHQADFSHTQFAEFNDIVGADERSTYVKDIVREKLLPPSPLGFVPLVREEDELSAEVDDVIELKARHSQENDKDIPEIEMENGFPKAFMDMLPDLFPKDAWDLNIEDGSIEIDDKFDDDRYITIEKEDYGVSFSGPTSNFDDIIRAAKAYDTALGDDAGIEYELEAGNKEQAIEFLQKMKAAGMNFDSVTSMIIDGESYDEAETQTFIAEALGLDLLDAAPEALGADEGADRRNRRGFNK